MKYQTLKARQQKEFNAFPLGAAFNEKQLQESLRRLGLDPIEGREHIIAIGGGCFIRETDKAAYLEMCDRHAQELADAIAADKTGDGFIFDMFRHELANHEYSYTGDTWETLDALGFTQDDIEKSEAMRHGLEKACKACLAEDF